MIIVRVGGRERRLGDEEFEIWLREGRVPPDALVSVGGAGWARADSLEDFRRLAPGASGRAPARPAGLRDVLFPKRSFSATEILILANLLVFAILAASWGEGYVPRLRQVTAAWWYDMRATHAYALWLPTIFMHAGAGHLLRNLIALLATAGAVEFLMGSGAAYGAYLITGIAAAWISYAAHGAPPLSVGASGAVFGLLGATVTFVIRRRRVFNYAQRWKVWRVYVPLFLLLSLPAIVNADLYAHAGGFATGLLLGIFLEPHPRVPALAAGDPFRDDDAPGADDSSSAGGEFE